MHPLRCLLATPRPFGPRGGCIIKLVEKGQKYQQQVLLPLLTMTIDHDHNNDRENIFKMKMQQIQKFTENSNKQEI